MFNIMYQLNCIEWQEAYIYLRLQEQYLLKI